MVTIKRFLFGLSALALAWSAPDRADAATFTATQSGTYFSSGTTNASIFAGGSSANHNFFVFDLASVAGQTVLAGELQISGDFGNFMSNTGTDVGTQTFQLYAFSGTISSLGTTSGTNYADLGTGALFGEASVTSPFSSNNSMPPVSVVLNAAAITYINSLLGGSDPFGIAFGGVCSTCNTVGFLWGTSILNPPSNLSLRTAPVNAVPLPAALPLLGAGLAGLGAVGWLRRRRTSASA